MAWVRNCKRWFLCNADGFFIVPRYRGKTIKEPTSYGINVFQAGEEDNIIADFPTEQAAIEELDRIQRWLEAGAPGVYQVSEDTP